MSKTLVPSNFPLTQSSLQSVEIDPKVSQFNPVKSKDDLGFDELDKQVADMKKGAAILAHNEGRKLYDLQQYREAVLQFSVAIDLAPKNWWQHYDRGLARTKLGLQEEAVNDFSEEIAINSEPIAQARSFYERGVAFDILEREEEALSDWRKVVKLNQEDNAVLEYSKEGIVRLDNKIGLELQREGRWEESFRYFDEAIEISPNDPELYYRRAFSYDKTNQFEKILHDLSRGIEVMPDNYPSAHLFYSSRGFAYNKLEDSENAIKDFDEFFKLRYRGYEEDLNQKVRKKYKEISGHEPQQQNDYNLFDIFMLVKNFGRMLLVVVPGIIKIFNDINRKPPFRENPEDGYNAIRNLAETAVNQIMKFENLDEDEKKGLLAIDVNQSVELFNKLMESPTPEKLDRILNENLASIEDQEQRNNVKELLKGTIENCIPYLKPRSVSGGLKSHLYDNMLLSRESERYRMNPEILKKCVTVFNEEVIRLLHEVHSRTHENAKMASFDVRPSSTVSLNQKEKNANLKGNGKCKA
jgi:tetratricopeptide (TPR) repeat protein